MQNCCLERWLSYKNIRVSQLKVCSHVVSLEHKALLTCQTPMVLFTSSRNFCREIGVYPWRSLQDSTLQSCCRWMKTMYFLGQQNLHSWNTNCQVLSLCGRRTFICQSLGIFKNVVKRLKELMEWQDAIFQNSLLFPQNLSWMVKNLSIRLKDCFIILVNSTSPHRGRRFSKRRNQTP